MEAVLKEAGDCGKFQACHVVFTQLPRFVTVWAVFLMMFGSYDPGWRCVKSRNNSNLDGNFNNTEYDQGTRRAISDSFDASTSNQRTTHPVPSIAKSGIGNESGINFSYLNPNLTKIRKTKYQNRNKSQHISNRTKDEYYDGECSIYDSCEEIEFNAESKTVLSHFNLVCDRAWMVKCIMLLQGVGYFIGALIGGQVGEKFGRKIGLYSSTLIVCLASGLAIFSPHWTVYALCIFFLGLGGNGVISLTSVFSVEFLNSKWRGYFGSLPTWNLSLLIFTLTTAAVKSWIYLHLITFIISFISCIGFLVVVESPRWLLMNGRPKQAEEAIRKIAKINGKPPPNFDRLLRLQADQKGGEEHEVRTYTYLDLFRTKEIRTPALKLSLLMGIFGVVYYAFGWGVQSLPGNFYVNAIVSSVIEIANLLLVGPLCNKTGRRRAGMFMASVGTISCFSIVVALFATEEGSTLQSTVIKAFAYEGKAASQAIFSITSLFIVEVLPTVVRNVGIGFCRCMAGLGTLLAPFLIPSHDVTSFAVCFAILCMFYVIQIIIFVSLPETNNLDLKDSLFQNGANNEIVVEPPEQLEEKDDSSNGIIDGV